MTALMFIAKTIVLIVVALAAFIAVAALLDADLALAREGGCTGLPLKNCFFAVI